MTKLEQVATAIVKAQQKVGATSEDMALAAVEALRQPNEHQYNALAATDKKWQQMDSSFVWQTYIDAILSEKPE